MSTVRGQIPKQTLLDAVERAAEAIRVTDFDEDYIGNRQVFVFCQYIKGVVIPAEADSSRLEPYLRTWYDRCNDVLVDECGDPLSYSEARSQFMVIWDGDKVKWAKGELLTLAEARARALPQPHQEFVRYDSPRVRHLGNTLAEAALLRGDGMVFISQKDAGRIMGRSERVGRETLLMFCADGILTRTCIGHTGWASEYRYTGKSNTGKNSNAPPF
jgi:hypothetical protein